MMVIPRLTCSAQTLQIILNLDHYSAIKTSLYLWSIKYGTNQKHVGYGLQTKKSSGFLTLSILSLSERTFAKDGKMQTAWK